VRRCRLLDRVYFSPLLPPQTAIGKWSKAMLRMAPMMCEALLPGLMARLVLYKAGHGAR
jgi:hypothetical protein